jgi:hypothetical protein
MKNHFFIIRTDLLTLYECVYILLLLMIYSFDHKQPKKEDNIQLDQI